MLNQAGLDLLFGSARTLRRWTGEAIDDETLRAIYALARLGPTSANLQHGRFVFVKSSAAKARLRPCLDEGNVAQTMAAPATVIAAYDIEFFGDAADLLERPQIRGWYDGKSAAEIDREALRNGTLQAAYLIMAARALGLDCGPMGGFDPAKVDAAFFPDGSIKSNFLINLGIGDRSGLHPRAPRFDFDQACRIE